MANSTRWMLKMKALIPRDWNKILEEWIKQGKYKSKAHAIREGIKRLIQDEQTERN